MLTEEEKKKLESCRDYVDGKLKLEVGSGIRPHPGYVHVDYCADTKKPCVEFQCDCRELPFDEETFDEILSIHLLEHIYWISTPLVLSEMNRVLKTGGKIRIEVPDFEVALKRGVNDTPMLYECIYMNNRGDGDSGNHDNFVPGFSHSSVFTFDILKRYMECAGFTVERDLAGERGSIHAWVGVLSVIGTKTSKPICIRNIEDKLGRGIMPESKWRRIYASKYGE